jgi:glycosyltransferase 2 family protein
VVADDASSTLDDVSIESTAMAAGVRRPADALRLAIALIVLVASLLLAGLAHVAVRTTERSLLGSVVTLPGSLRDVLSAVVQLAVVVVPAALVVVVVAGRRFALGGRLIIAAAAGSGVGVLISHLLLTDSHPATWHQLLAGRGGLFAATFPPVVWLSGATVMLTVAAPALSRRWRSGLWWLAGSATLVEVIVGGFLPLDAVAAAAAGVSVGSLVLLALGGPDSRPAGTEVAVALQQCGVDVVALKELAPSVSGPATFSATTAEGVALLVRVFADDDRDRDRLSRLWRRLVMRDPQDDRDGTTVQAAAEHEILATVSAVRAGARVPDPVVAYPVATRRGHRGALAAFIEVEGRRLDLLASDEVGDATLADLWHGVARLHEHRIAHRLLRADNVIVDADGNAWLTGFALAELGASDRQLAVDVAELLASLATAVGVRRAVAAAIASLGPEPVREAEPYLQPLALLSATRAKVREHDRSRAGTRRVGRSGRRLQPGGRPDLLGDVRTEIASATSLPAGRLEPLARFTPKTALTLLGAFAVIYLVLPQLADAGAALTALRGANWWELLAVVPALFVAQAFSTVLQIGAIPAQLPFGPTYVVQLGGSFLNRVTPHNVGGMALNFRYLQRAGVDTGAATGSVGLQSLAGDAANLVLLAAFAARTGRGASPQLSLHRHQWLLLAVTGVLVAGALVGLTPRGRRFFHDKIWGFLRSAGITVAEVAKSPQHVALIVVGALGVPMVQVVAFAVCAHAVGGSLPFVQLAAAYLGAHLLSSAAPVPGGLGALEAALIAGLSSLGMPIGPAASAVLTFRLLTFWLAIPVGWASLKGAQRAGYV